MTFRVTLPGLATARTGVQTGSRTGFAVREASEGHKLTMNADKISSLQELMAVQRTRFPAIGRIVFDRLNDLGVKGRYDIAIHFVDDREDSNESLFVRARDIADQRFDLSNFVGGVVLTISDIRDRQLEGLQYEVRDVEDEFVYFKCRDIDAEIVREASKG